MSRILAIEDNPAHLALITALVSEFGHTPIAAGDAESGLRMIDEERPDLVLCDIRLPTLSGYETVRRIKSDPATRRLPVIAVTAVADSDEALQAGFDSFLTKPVAAHRLRAEIERVLPPVPRGLREARPAPPADAADAWTATAQPRSGKRILVLDNTAGNRELMKAVLEYGGHDVTCARTVAEALATAKSWRPDLVLCDVHLDRELGTDLLNAVRLTPELRATRFAFTSASPGPSREHELRQAGACAYLRFPMKADVLLRKVGDLLG